MPEIVLSLTEGDERDIKQIAQDRNEREIGSEKDQEAGGIDASLDKRIVTKMMVLGQAFAKYATGIHALTKELHTQNPDLPPDELAIMVKKIAIEKGITAPPSLDLCTVAVPGSNIFCGGAKKLDRAQMPQLKSAESEFLALLKKNKVGVTEGERMSPNEMRATQSHINADKVAGMAFKLLSDPNADKDTHPLRAPLLVSADHYVLDGHHRWAALATYDALRGRTEVTDLKVIKIDLEIDDLLEVANSFADEQGLQRKGLTGPAQQPGKAPLAPKAPTAPKSPSAPVAPKASKGVTEKKPSKITESRLLTEDTVNLVDYNTARSLAQKAGFNPDRVTGRLLEVPFNNVPSDARKLKMFAFTHEEGEIPAILFYDKMGPKSKGRPDITINGVRYQYIERWDLDIDDKPAPKDDPRRQQEIDRKQQAFLKQGYDAIVRAIQKGKTIYARGMTSVTPISSTDYVRLGRKNLEVMQRGKWVAMTLEGAADMFAQAGGDSRYLTIYESRLYEHCDTMSAERVTQMLQSQIGKEYYAVERAECKQIVKQKETFVVQLARGETWSAALRVARDKFGWARDLMESSMLKESTDINALLKSAGINLRSTVSSKDPATMTAAEINKDLDAVDKISSAHTDAMIAAGRGNERPSDYLKASDPLSKLARAMFDRRSDLKNEVQMRYGNNISRLPTGSKFGPRKKLGESTMSTVNEDAKSVTCPECDKSFKNAPNGKLPVHSIYGERCPGSGQLGESRDWMVTTIIEATKILNESTAFKTYEDAYEYARTEANKFNRPMGLEQGKEYGRTVFRVMMIPKDPKQRQGFETRVEVVEPGSPKAVIKK